nr:MAG TPA: hypothetical protein [Caudoviricetes sp.]
MNYVYVVNSSGIEVIKMNNDLSRMISLVSKPINADLLFHLHGLKANNLDNPIDNPTLKHYYNNVLELDVRITDIGGRDRNVVKYLNVENLSEKWFHDLRLTLAIIANECGEKDIANFTKPSSTVGVSATLSSYYNGSNLPHAIRCCSTFTIVTKLDGEEGISLNIGNNDDKTLDNVNVQQGDVFLFTDRYLLEKASLAFRGDVELLSVDVNPSIDIKGQQDIGLEDYLKGNINPTEYVKTTVTKMDTLPFTYKWTSGKE